MNQNGLIIGINYPGSNSSLNGCVNDAIRCFHFCLDIGFKIPEITLVIDDNPTIVTNDWQKPFRVQPTKKNIIDELNKLSNLSNVNEGGIFWISISGHGTQMDGDDKLDGLDEVFLTGDFQMIRDSEFREVIDAFHPSSTIFWLMDSCHSGTILDLNENTVPRCGVICITGCRDIGVSMDAYDNYYRESAGALTYSLLTEIRERGTKQSIQELFSGLQSRMKLSGFTQRPQMNSCNFNLDTEFYRSLTEGVHTQTNEDQPSTNTEPVVVPTLEPEPIPELVPQTAIEQISHLLPEPIPEPITAQPTKPSFLSGLLSWIFGNSGNQIPSSTPTPIPISIEYPLYIPTVPVAIVEPYVSNQSYTNSTSYGFLSILYNMNRYKTKKKKIFMGINKRTR